MNNRWMYGVALVAFGIIALRGGLVAVQGRAWWARSLGALALLMALVTGGLLVLFLLNKPIPPLAHASALVGALAVVVHQAARVAQASPGASYMLVGIYGALAFLMPRRRAPRPPPVAPDDADDGDDAGENT
jgi:hypothetical protein